MKYKVKVAYRADVTVEVEAENEKEAHDKGLVEADESLLGNIRVYDMEVKAV